MSKKKATSGKLLFSAKQIFEIKSFLWRTIFFNDIVHHTTRESLARCKHNEVINLSLFTHAIFSEGRSMKRACPGSRMVNAIISSRGNKAWYLLSSIEFIFPEWTL